MWRLTRMRRRLIRDSRVRLVAPSLQSNGVAGSGRSRARWSLHTPDYCCLVGYLRRVIDANVRLSIRLDRRINPDHGDLHRAFITAVRDEMSRLPEGSVVADLGGGRRCYYVDCLPDEHSLHLVAVDISADELAANTDVAECRIANVAEGLPFADGEVSLVLSRMLLEHVDGVPAAANHMGRVLAEGGVAIHFLPCRYSTFALAARLLPFGLLLALLHRVSPGTRGEVEFDVFYDDCYPRALERAFHDAGFQRVEVRVEYVSTSYYWSIFPLFLLVAAYERLVRGADARSLAAYLMVYAER
jgi:SAM-dependent methyltransferase